MDALDAIRKHVREQLQGGQAYETFDEITASIPRRLRGVVPSASGHSAWQILEHMRISQRDLLDFSRNENGKYIEKKWPEDYWPFETSPPTPDAWDESVHTFLSDRADFEKLIGDPHSDLFTPFRWGDGQTLLHEALLACDHAAYHLGQLVLLQRLLAS